MGKGIKYIFPFAFLISSLSYSQSLKEVSSDTKDDSQIRTGAERTADYLPIIKGKAIALAANHTSLIGNTHLADSLLALGINIKIVFSPEHGFRGEADAGEKINDSTDKKTGIRIISLYGERKKPSAKDFEGIDAVVFDMQDVGVRCYTYLTTLRYLMEACAEYKKKLIVLDRPNPNGFYVDGPVLEKKFTSFVGMDPLPLVHGLTLGEYAKMVNGESWLKDKIQCDLTVIACEGYRHADFYELPVKPSPNLPNMAAVYLYPSLVLFEGTIVSVGRGTDLPFQSIGYPGFNKKTFSFTPKSMPGAKKPPYEGQLCYGVNLSAFGDIYLKNLKGIYIYWLKGFYETAPDKKKFFNSYFENLAGTSKLRSQIMKGVKEEEIRKSWQEGLNAYKVIRKKYLLYQDFE